MTIKRLTGLLASVALFGASLPHPVYAAGSLSNLPVVGGSAYCSSWIGSPTGQALPTGTGGGTGAGAVCAQMVPAGPPSPTGDMMSFVDIPDNAAGGAQPQSALMPFGLYGTDYNNLTTDGDFGVNLWQRPAVEYAGISPTTYVMTADRWAAVSAGDVMTVTKNTPISSAADYLGNIGLYSWMRVARPSGTPTSSMCEVRVLDQKASAKLIGNNAVLSFWGYAPSTYSATSGDVQVSIAYYTATDSATPGTNTGLFALSASGQAGGIAGYTAVTAGQGLGGTTSSNAAGIETIPFTTTPTRYSVYGAIPSTAIGVGISFCGTPTLTTTVATDYFEIEGVQLEAKSSTVTTQFPAGVVSPRGYQYVQPADEMRRELYYSYILQEGATLPPLTSIPVLCSASTAALITVPLPMYMREIPSFTLNAAGGWKIQTAVAQTAIGTTTLVSANTTTAELTSAAACTTTVPYQLVATGTTGTMTFSAEP